MSDEQLQITNVGFLPDGIEIGYIRVPRDVRKNGLLWTHSVLVPIGSDYDEEIETFMDALRALLDDALDDEDRAEPINPNEEEEEPDDGDE